MLQFQYRLGQTYQLHLGRVDQAIEQYKEILAAAPEHEPALGALEELFANGVEPMAIGEILEPLYRMSESWDRLVGVYQVELEQVADSEQRLAKIHRIAEIAEDRAAEPQIAFEWHQRALLEHPSDERSTSDAERLAGALGNWEQLADTLATVCAQTQDPATRLQSGHRLARILENELGDVQRAVDAHLFVLATSPQDAESLEALDRIYVENGASEALQEVLDRRIPITEDVPSKVDLAFRRAQVLENDLGRIDEAVGVYQGLLANLDKEHEPSIQALANIYTEKRDWRNLYATFEKELGVALGDSGRSDVLAKMARLSSAHLGEDNRAITTWTQVLDLRGEDPEALNALGDLHARAGRFDALVEVLDRESVIASDDDARVRIFADLGRIWYAKLKNDNNAIENWRRVLEIEPANTDALFALIEIYRASNATPELVESLQRVIEVGTATLDDATIETCYMQLGALFETTLEQPADAIDAFNKALDLNANNYDAMDALERLHAANGEWVEQVQIFERRADALEAPEAKIATLTTIAQDVG